MHNMQVSSCVSLVVSACASVCVCGCLSIYVFVCLSLCLHNALIHVKLDVLFFATGYPMGEHIVDFSYSINEAFELAVQAGKKESLNPWGPRIVRD